MTAPDGNCAFCDCVSANLGFHLNRSSFRSPNRTSYLLRSPDCPPLYEGDVFLTSLPRLSAASCVDSFAPLRGVTASPPVPVFTFCSVIRESHRRSEKVTLPSTSQRYTSALATSGQIKRQESPKLFWHFNVRAPFAVWGLDATR
jgi:hypothetical protein